MTRPTLRLVPTTPAEPSAAPSFGYSTDAPSFTGVQVLRRRRRPRLSPWTAAAMLMVILALALAVLAWRVLA